MLLVIQNFLIDRLFTWLVCWQLAMAASLLWNIYRESREQKARMAIRHWRQPK